jgi:hypothetical protein
VWPRQVTLVELGADLNTRNFATFASAPRLAPADLASGETAAVPDPRPSAFGFTEAESIEVQSLALSELIYNAKLDHCELTNKNRKQVLLKLMKIRRGSLGTTQRGRGSVRRGATRG